MNKFNGKKISLGLVCAFAFFMIQGCSGPEDGISGKNGSSCHVEAAVNGALIFCDDGSNALIANGSQGAVGPQGPAGVPGLNGMDGRDGVDSIIEIIDPCGNNPGQFDEVILKLSNGELLAYFESSGNRFLSIIGNGSYRTTDRQECNFNVNNGQVTW